jgi:hypothetical protein
MEFDSDTQKEVYEKIKPWIGEIFGEFAVAHEDGPTFGIMVGSAYTQVGVFPWGKAEATITARSYVVTGAELTPDLMLYLLNENDRTRFGSFGVDPEKDIFFEHTIIGSTCDKEELRASVMAVVMTADEYDDQIVAKWGGQTARDRMK